MADRVREVAATEFKAHCLQLMDQVQQSRAEIIVTKHGRAVARLVPMDEAPTEVFGLLAGTVQAADDLTAPIDSAWEADA
jgi:prevent-host-death family protein